MTTPRLSLTSLGIILRIVSGLLFTAMSVCVKLVSDSVPLGEIVFFRSGFAMIPLVAFLMLRREFPHGLATRRPVGHLIRSGLGAMAMFAGFASIIRLPLADATLVTYVTPLLTALLGGLLLGEALTRPKMVGIALGMAGVLALTLPELNPSELDMTRLAGYGYGLLCGVLTAGALIQVRRLGKTESPGAIAFYFVLVSMLASLLTLPAGWLLPEPRDFTILVLAGIFGGFAHIALTLALRYAEASTLAPFEYLALIWAGVADLLIFNTGLSPWFLLALPLLLTGAAVSTGTLGRRVRKSSA